MNTDKPTDIIKNCLKLRKTLEVFSVGKRLLDVLSITMEPEETANTGTDSQNVVSLTIC